MYIRVSPEHLTRCASCSRHLVIDETSLETLLSQTCHFCGAPLVHDQLKPSVALNMKSLGSRSSRLTTGLLSAGLLLGGCRDRQTDAGQMGADQMKVSAEEEKLVEDQAPDRPDGVLPDVSQANKAAKIGEAEVKVVSEDPHHESESLHEETPGYLGALSTVSETLAQGASAKNGSERSLSRLRTAPPLTAGAYGGPPSLNRGSGSKPKLKLKPVRVISGELLPRVINRVVRSRGAVIRRCYERELLSKPNLRGEVSLRVTVSAKGRVARAEQLSSSLKSDVVERCVIRSVRKLRFPKSKIGKSSTFSLSMLFSR